MSTAASTPGGPSGDDIRKYIWDVYVDHKPPTQNLDEGQLLAFFAKHYVQQDFDEDCFYFGILAYERAFTGDPATRIHHLKTAQAALRAYRQISGETTWDVVEDRLNDVTDCLAAEDDA